jgi:hypothetical protein
MHYATNLKTCLSNPAYDCVFNPFTINNPIQFNLLDFYDTLKINSYINLDGIAPMVIPENPPWINPKPTFNFELTKYKKS